jgi:hypothetical protein
MITLKTFGRSFASREKARLVLEATQAVSDQSVIDARDVVVSPSFGAELMVTLSHSAPTLTVIVDDVNERTFSWLVSKLALGNVTIKRASVPVGTHLTEPATSA